MAPYSTIMEKCMLPLGGKPIIRILIDKILASKIALPQHVYISVLEKNVPMFKHEFRDTAVHINGVKESRSTCHHYAMFANTVGLGPEDDVMIHYADNLAEINYTAMAKEYAEAVDNRIFFMAAATKLVKHDYSLIQYDSEMNQSLNWLKENKESKRFFNMATKFIEKPYVKDPSWMGIMMARHGRLMQAIRTAKHGKDTRRMIEIDFGYDVLPFMASKNELAVYLYDGEWFDVGNSIAYTKLIKRVETGEFRIS